ncbi:extracellular solute-binding protein [Nesterenkonia lutea]|uniref:extracellular solute-binding protein n=1 Tax=Nesterenkonia lutea TaxID=272919 RepID=UPI0031D85A2B
MTDVLGKVRSGEADAGLVYSTDVRLAAAEVDAVDIPEAAEFPNRYPAAVLAESAQPEAAAAFLEFLLTEDGQRPLREAGFTPAGES